VDSFTWIPSDTTKPKVTALNRRVEYEAGNEDIQRIAVNPKKTWEYTYKGVMATHDELQAFFESHCNGQQFLWTDIGGTQHTVTFATDDFAPTEQLGWDEDGYGAKGFNVTLTFRKVWTP